MRSDNIFIIIAGVLSLAPTVAIIFWHKITDWAGKALFPWLEKNFKEISGLVKDAFVWFDKNVAVPIRNIAKQAWKKLREFLLKMIVNFQRKSSSEWIRKWTGYLIKKLDTGEFAPVRFEIVETVSWDELPKDIRTEWLKKGMDIPKQDLNITEIRDKQMDMSH